MLSRLVFASCLIFTAAAPLAAADEILEPGSKPIKAVDGCEFTEGPVVDAKGNVLFSDGPNDRIMQLAPDGTLTEFRKPCGRVNGMTMDGQGRLVVCQSSGEGGKRRVARFEPDGRETVLSEKFEGKRFIAPNDVCLDADGRIFFTDPYYGPPAEKSQPTSGVYRIDPDGRVTRVLNNLLKPNGIVITPDNRLIYISDRGTQKLHRYELQSDGSLKPAGIVYDFSPDRGVDGMRLDVEGNIYAAAGQDKTTGLFVVSPKGKLLLHQPLPEFSTNVVFGGEDRRDLYITATTGVYRLRTRIAGAPVPSPQRNQPQTEQ
jgi:gluconolactonase